MKAISAQGRIPATVAALTLNASGVVLLAGPPSAQNGVTVEAYWSKLPDDADHPTFRIDSGQRV